MWFSTVIKAYEEKKREERRRAFEKVVSRVGERLSESKGGRFIA